MKRRYKERTKANRGKKEENESVTRRDSESDNGGLYWVRGIRSAIENGVTLRLKIKQKCGIIFFGTRPCFRKIDFEYSCQAFAIIYMPALFVPYSLSLFVRYYYICKHDNDTVRIPLSFFTICFLSS